MLFWALCDQHLVVINIHAISNWKLEFRKLPYHLLSNGSIIKILSRQAEELALFPLECVINTIDS